MSDILYKISQKFESLTQSQKTVANYIMENINSIAFNTLDDLALKIGVSTTTIIRFARILGYNGYSDMQQDIQSKIRGKVSLPQRLNESLINLKRDKLLIDTYENDIANIKNTFANVSEEDLKAAINSIITGKTVYVLGLRSSFSLAYYIASRLSQIKDNIRFIQAIGMTYPEEIVGAKEGDVCITFMFPRYSKMTANIVTTLKKRKVKIILFTSSNYSAIKSYGDIILPCSVKSQSFKNSFVAPMCLCNYLVAAISVENYSNAVNVLNQTEEILSYGYYLGL